MKKQDKVNDFIKCMSAMNPNNHEFFTECTEDFNHNFEKIILNVVGIKKEYLYNEKKDDIYVTARYIVFNYLRINTNYTTEDIGAIYNRDQSLITYGANRSKDLVSVNDSYHCHFYNEFNKQIQLDRFVH